MKKSIVWILFLATLVGCKRNNDSAGTVMDFEVTVSRIESHRVWLDIIPKSEFLPYYLDWMPLEEYQSTYDSDKAYLDEITQIFSSVDDEKVRRRMCNEGAYMSAIMTTPATTYVLLISQITGTQATILRKVNFSSAEEHLTTFSLGANAIRFSGNGHISINPEDTVNTYFWDFDLKKTVDKNWGGAHSILFYYDSEFYYSMDFFPDILSRGYDEDNFYNYFLESEVAKGDTICLVAVGYDETGETSKAYMPFWIIYLGPDNDAVVVDAEPDGWESLYRNVVVYKPERRDNSLHKPYKIKQH